MKKIHQSLLTVSIMLALSSGNVLGEAGISVTTHGKTPAPVTANVKFKINIPKMLILRVGDWGSNENTVEWNYAFGSLSSDLSNADATAEQWEEANKGAPGARAADTDNEKVGKAEDGKLAIAIFSNTGGNLELKATSTNFVRATASGPDGVGHQPRMSEISAKTTDDGSFSNTSSVTHPKLVDSGDSPVVTLKAEKGIFRSLGTWDYIYTPTAGVLPVGGVYEGSVLYTLTSL